MGTQPTLFDDPSAVCFKDLSAGDLSVAEQYLRDQILQVRGQLREWNFRLLVASLIMLWTIFFQLPLPILVLLEIGWGIVFVRFSLSYHKNSSENKLYPERVAELRRLRKEQYVHAAPFN